MNKIKNKIAYPSSPVESEITTPSPEEVDSLSSTEMGSRGVGLTEMIGEFDDSANPDIDPNENNPLNKSSEANLLDMLISLSDSMDSDGLEVYADFSDFLIEKFATAINKSSKLDPTSSFNELLVKIKRADIPNSSDVIKKLTKIYSRTVVLENMKNNNLEKSKESAYKKVLHRANKYLSET